MFEKMLLQVKRLMLEDSGQNLIEYALVVSLIGLAAIASMGRLSGAIANVFYSGLIKVATVWPM